MREREKRKERVRDRETDICIPTCINKYEGREMSSVFRLCLLQKNRKRIAVGQGYHLQNGKF